MSIGSTFAGTYSVTFPCGKSATFSCDKSEVGYMMRVLENYLCGRQLQEQ
ncbi:hypothetical protein TRIP_D390011 [uncultured Paludibacter sp.]|uniref:Uncharacterized protein n=1 Tax=uncultured Paludibacter sp. TaxID=497635 RepID=A0A653AE83_9BACT|nr:hypothetical protein TRIP_D390011 [uncultured Paludibacter sp.]